jgi:DNA-binding beta-propeller fold protein YncE
MLFALTVAGEKMPWLIVHVTVPMILLAAKIMDDLLTSIGTTTVEPEPAPPPKTRGRKAAQQAPPPTLRERLSPYAPFFYSAVLAVVATLFFIRFGPASPYSLFPWFFSAAALGVVIWAGSRGSWRLAGQVAVIAFVGSLLVFTLRTSALASYDHGNPNGGVPHEILMYAQGAQDLVPVYDQINQFARETGRGHELKIIMDKSGDANVWPWPWYLRDYVQSEVTVEEGFTPEPGTVLLATSANRDKVDSYSTQIDHRIDYTHMWWFPPDIYRGLDVGQFLGDFFTGHYFSIWPRYFIDRELANQTDTDDRTAYFFRDFSPEEVAPAPPLDPASITPIGGGAGSGRGQFSQPGDIALDQEGNLYIVDTLNHRIQRINAEGNATVLGEAGTGPGQFASVDPSDGPWGIGVDQEGNVYVADTWNHRIQKFGPDLQFIKEWGHQIAPERFGTGQAEPMELYGPRDVAIDNDGNVLVVDTGDQRIVKYNPDGQFIQAYGQAGAGPGQFNEPSSVAVALNGDIYVADYWNRRIQHFDSQFVYKDEIEVPAWGSQGITDRAYIAILGDGKILATDPAHANIMVIDPADPSGEPKEWRLVEGNARPIGIAVDADGQVYITDSLNSTISRVALATLLAPTPTPAASLSPTPTAPPP